MHSSVIIWNNDIIHSCPYRLIKPQVKFIFKINSFNTQKGLRSVLVVYNEELNWAFQLKNIINTCNSELVETTEGVYLTTDKKFSKLINIKYSNYLQDSSSEIAFQLADNDFKMLKELQIDNDLLYKHCQDYQTQLNLFKFMDDKFNFSLMQKETNLFCIVETDLFSNQIVIRLIKLLMFIIVLIVITIRRLLYIIKIEQLTHF
jgi:hypothetical protein